MLQGHCSPWAAHHRRSLNNNVRQSGTGRQGRQGCRHPCRAAHSSVTSSNSGQASTSAVPVSEFNDFVEYIHTLQDKILKNAEALEGNSRSFIRDRWDRSATDANAGYGMTCVLEDGALLEKAAANITVVRGALSSVRAAAMSSRGRTEIDPAGGQAYAAAAMSLVFHSAHPLVPTLRADVRLFQVAGQSWFGGGTDLTPFYIDAEQIGAFHRYWKSICDKYDPKAYAEFKAWCDRYFYIPARKEHRGVGGLFFDDLSAPEVGYDVAAFVRDVGDGILPSWLPIAEANRSLPFTNKQREWQLLRRGRYLEFNLLYDRGVKFGLEGGRIESIMVSAPPRISWKYNVQPAAGSPEADLISMLQAPREWV